MHLSLLKPDISNTTSHNHSSREEQGVLCATLHSVTLKLHFYFKIFLMYKFVEQKFSTFKLT